MAIWARRTKCHSPPYPYQYENKNNLMKWFTMYVGCVQGSTLLHDGLTEVKLLLYRYAIVILYKFTLGPLAK